MTIARHVWITGLVQGVGFRWYAREQARDLGLVGWVKNLSDGRVEAWIEGPSASVESMLAWLERGPPSGHVSDLDVREAEPERGERFEVVR